MAFILTCASSIGLSVATDYVKEGIKKGINQLRYFFCLAQFNDQLAVSANELAPIQQLMRRRLEQEAMNLMLPDEPVDDWMKRADENMEKSCRLQDEIKQDKRCLNQCSPDWLWRYRKSKEADMLTKTLKDLKQSCTQAPNITHQANLPNVEFNVSQGFILSKAAESALVDIMQALQTDGVTMIGLHGMPGVGKTTLANQVKAEAERKRLFDEFVKVTVTEKPNLSSIQDRVAEQLQLKFKGSSMQQRASELMLRLQDEKKKLLVLDDVWGEHNLNRIGIPSADDLKKCKILLTTRRIPVCESMDCQRKILLDILTEDEAWALFKNAAKLEDDSSSEELAKMVVRECGRLPVAIVSVGKALRGKPAHGWERALKKLQEGEHESIRDMSKEENAYRSLKFSFDELPREETKRCLLLCSMFPEDHEICVENLSKYAHGLRLYHRTHSIQDTMSEVLDALDELKDSHLLLEAESKGHVKMHDLVRDVVLLIGQSYVVVRDSNIEKKFIVGSSIGLEEWPTDERFKDCAVLSLLDYEIDQLPDQMDYPSLQMLLLSRKTSVPEGYVQREFTSIPHQTFKGAGKLEVLSLTRGILSMQSLESLTNLRSLELRYCKFSSGKNATTNFSSLRNLKMLEILSFYGSDIGELPDEIGELKFLKVLDLTNCYGLDNVPPNMIRKLSKLEELYIGNFEDWKAEGQGASVVELNSLRHLAILSFAARGHMPKDFTFHNHNLIGFHLHMCDCESPDFQPRLRYPTVRTICMVLTEVTVSACKELFNSVYHLRIDWGEKCFKNMVPDVSQIGFKDLSRLEVYGCEMECFVSTAKQQKVAKNVLSNLVELEIGNTNLREICEGPPPDHFLEKLQSLSISGCDQLITILPSKLLQGMHKLEKVMVEECEDLQDVFQLDGLDEANNECLSYLKSLELYMLDALMCIWKGPRHHVNLKSLTRLTVRSCNSLPSLFSVSLAKNLVHLENLDVEGCGQLECIITEDDEYDRKEAIIEDRADIDAMKEIMFPKLRKLCLEELPRLVLFSPRGYHLKFPSLQLLKVKKCPEMATSFSRSAGCFSSCQN